MSRHLRDLRGDPGKRGRRRGAQVPGAEAPTQPPPGDAATPPPAAPFQLPAGMPRAVRAAAEKLVAACRGMGIPIRSHHGAILELTASALVEHRAIQRGLAREGRSYKCKTEGGAVMIRKHPLLEASGEAWRRAVTGLTKLGLTPADLERVAGHTGGGSAGPAPSHPQEPPDGPSDGLSDFDH